MLQKNVIIVNLIFFKNDFNTDVTFVIKINESRYIALFVVSGSIKGLFSIDYVNIYIF